MTNTLFVASVAYQLAMSPLMLGEANRIAQELDLPCKKPILMGEIRRPFVAHPDLRQQGNPDFGGTITSSNFWFSFINGKCWKIVRCNLFPKDKPYEFADPLPYFEDLAKAPLKVTTNSAYSLATNWLTRFRVNITELEAKHTHTVFQQEFHNGSGDLQKTGIFHVQWGPGSDGAVKITILGTTGELMLLVVDDPSLNHQPSISLPNWKELMATPEKMLQKTAPKDGSQ
jgi:hypothetical protein